MLEKPSFLLFGLDLCSLMEAALLPPYNLEGADLWDYREEHVLSLSSALEHAVSSIKEAQKWYKRQYDKKTRTVPLRTWRLGLDPLPPRRDRQTEEALQTVAWPLPCHYCQQARCHSSQSVLPRRRTYPGALVPCVSSPTSSASWLLLVQWQPQMPR